MQVPSTGVKADFSRGQELWNIVRARREALRHRKETLDFVEERLGGLLFGVDLDEEQAVDYARRLGGTVEQARRLGEGPQLRGFEEARVPREQVLWRAGGIGWRAFPITKRAVAVTPMHRRVQDRMALALNAQRQAFPESARTTVYAVRFQVARGAGEIALGGEDRLDLSGWGVSALMPDRSTTLFERTTTLPQRPVQRDECPRPRLPSPPHLELLRVTGLGGYLRPELI